MIWSKIVRIGFGYDLHKLIKDRELILGGVVIPSIVGEAGHSDGDVLIHAIIDALLGAAAAEDIGSHFPSTDPVYKNISSRILLKKTLEIISGLEYVIVNIDCTIILQAPKILPYVMQIRETIAEDLGVLTDSISVKGKTKEGVDAAGEKRAVEAYAVVLLEKTDKAIWV